MENKQKFSVITAFEGKPENVFAKRILPFEDAEIKKMMPDKGRYTTKQFHDYAD